MESEAAMAYVVSTEDAPKKSETIVEKAKKCWKLAREAWADQYARERDDIAFQIPENQWTEKAREQRKGRPMLSVSLTRQPMQLVQNQASAAQLGVDIHPVTEDATDDLAETKQGIYRRIERDSSAKQARLWALDRAKQCGRGWYRVNTQWDEDGDDEWDQEIVIERILYQDSVYIDPSAQKPDFSDAEWAFVSSWVPRERFRREFPKAKISEATDHAFRDMAGSEPDWVKVDNGKEAILVVEYFYKVHDYKTIEGPDGRKRTKDTVSVKWCKIAGCEDEPLEETDWPGRYIPLIPVIGIELQPMDGQRRWEGMVRPAMDAQRIYNHAISSVVEDISRLSKAPYIGAHGQFEGFEDQWENINTTNQPYAEYNAKVDGIPNPLPPPSPMQIDGSKMQLSLQLVQMGKELIQSATAIYDPSLGVGERGESGRKVLALQQQADAGTSNYTQNLAEISMRYEAMVILDLMPKIYDRPGRITRVLGGEEETRSVMLNQPFQSDPRTGQPVPVEVKDEMGQPIPAELLRQGAQLPPDAKLYDLSRGKYSLTVTVGKSHQTRLQEGAEEVGKILEAAPELMPIIGPTYFRFRDFPGAKEIADLLKQLREKTHPGLGDTKDKQSPEQLQAQLAAAQQQMQEMQQVIEQMNKALETDAQKQQAQMAKAQMDNAAKVQIAQEDNATKLAVAQMQAEQKTMLEGIAAQIERQMEAIRHAFETRTHREQMAHEIAKQNDQQQHERVLQREKGMLDVAKQGMQIMHADATAERDEKSATRERHEGMAHEAAMAAGKGTTIEYKREGAQEQDSEQAREQSSGASRVPKQPKGDE